MSALRLKYWQKIWMVPLLTLMLLGSNQSFVGATPREPGYIPYEVGLWEALNSYCSTGDDIIGNIVSLFGNLYCNQTAERLKNHFGDAYRTSENEGASPGFPTNQLHFWRGTVIQDFTGGNWGDGALIWSQNKGSKPQYVGGGAWKAYRHATDAYGVWPGYPTDNEHSWGDVRIQNFRGGSWGDGAIIGGGSAELVAGNHLKAYGRADGSRRLRNPKTFMVEKYDGFETTTKGFVGPRKLRQWWVQYFDGGEIWESRGDVKVLFYDKQEWSSFRV